MLLLLLLLFPPTSPASGAWASAAARPWALPPAAGAADVLFAGVGDPFAVTAAAAGVSAAGVAAAAAAGGVATAALGAGVAAAGGAAGFFAGSVVLRWSTAVDSDETQPPIVDAEEGGLTCGKVSCPEVGVGSLVQGWSLADCDR